MRYSHVPCNVNTEQDERACDISYTADQQGHGCTSSCRSPSVRSDELADEWTLGEYNWDSFSALHQFDGADDFPTLTAKLAIDVVRPFKD